ncbi:MAG: hypothetical protein J7L78_03400, partial [Dehalococcoidales bacterium]|nr:hypothetical protein [Dehalococcoidales bacterium]
PYAYCALVTRNLTPNTTWRYPVGWDKESLECRYNTDGSSYWEYVLRYSTDGSGIVYSAKVGFGSSSYGWVVIECVVNANEKIMRSPKESYHVDDSAGAALYSYTGTLSSWYGGNTGNAEVGALIYGGATTSAPLETLASVVKGGESGALLTEMFREFV